MILDHVPGTAPHFSTMALSLARALVPNLHLLDSLYPVSPFLISGGAVELCLFPENIPENVADFYASFRQGGGINPILSFDEALPKALNRAEAAEVPLLVALHSANSFSAAQTLRQNAVNPPLLLLTAELVEDVLPPLYGAGYEGHCILRLVQGDQEENFCFLSPSLNTSELVQDFENVGKMVAEDMRLVASVSDAEPDTVVIYLSELYSTLSNDTLSPLMLVHDGIRMPEGDQSYSWLWNVNRNQLRLLLGPVNQRYRRVRVILPNAGSTANLRHARLLLNGQTVTPDVEVWSEGSGALSTDLPDYVADPLIIGVWVPEGKLQDDGITRLFVCIDRIELSA